jgi:parallel beta-helix repeat protein
MTCRFRPLPSSRLFVPSLLLLALACPALGADLPPNPEAVAEVTAGTQTEANAAWWGFNSEDATEVIQSAIDSGAPKVVVPFMGAPWIVRPITLRSNLELVFDPGVLILAKKGEFKGGGDSLFRAVDQHDIAVRGYGATLRMRKADYQSDAYERAEWRMGLSFSGCQRIHIEGVRVESTGGDGIYIGSSGKNRWCEDVTIRDCVCHDNHRQGISIISAQNLLIENCVFSSTDGTAPEAGIDLEADSPDERFVNCVIRNCVMENNSGHAILVYLKPMTRESEPVSILFENCHVRMGRTAGLTLDDFSDMNQTGWAGMCVGAIKDDGPKGLIEFRNCTSENTGKEGVKIFDKSADSARVRFVNCRWSNPWVSSHRGHGGARVPILLNLRRASLTEKLGGVDFVDCAVFDSAFRPAVLVEEDKSALGVYDLTGQITVYGPGGMWTRLGSKQDGVTLEVVEAPKAAE